MNTKILLFTIIMLFFSSQEAKLPAPQPKLELPVISLPADTRSELIAVAKSYLGSTYQYAGSNPEQGFDCSGFVYFVYKQFNLEVPRSSRAYINLGPALNPEAFQIGDILVFYSYTDPAQIGHVGIISEANGMNSKFIHASSGKTPGVIISDLGSKFYTHRFYKCIDVMG